MLLCNPEFHIQEVLMQNYKEALEKDGFFVLKNVLIQDEVATFRKTLQELSGFNESEFVDQHPLKTLFKKTPKKFRFTEADGVTKNKALWPLLWNKKTLDVLNSIFSKPVHLLHHNDIHVGFSASGWHRDSVDRHYNEGPEWDESDESYELVRVGYYLMSYDECKFALGVLPGTHKYESKLTIFERFFPSKLGKLGRLLVALRYFLIGQNLFTHKAFWYKPEPGDCIVFNPKILHNGMYPRGPKYSMFVGYGVPGRHYDRMTDFYENRRKDLSYSSYSDELRSELEKHNLVTKK